MPINISLWVLTCFKRVLAGLKDHQETVSKWYEFDVEFLQTVMIEIRDLYLYNLYF